MSSPTQWNPKSLPEVIHLCPPGDSNVMPCCGRTPHEVPVWHRLTTDAALVTCDPGRMAAR